MTDYIEIPMIGNCPFCGGAPEVEASHRYVRIRCTRCRATCAAQFDEEKTLTSPWLREANQLYAECARMWNKEDEA